VAPIQKWIVTKGCFMLLMSWYTGRMSIYTKTGDKGKTGLFGGKRVWKYDPQVEAYGITDEATCEIGLVIVSLKDQDEIHFLTAIQHDLYTIMAYLSGAQLKKNDLEENVYSMEKQIDQLDKTLPTLTRFILPQGSEISVRLHLARAKVRSAERRIVEFVEQKQSRNVEDDITIQYVNRLSDFLFMLARKYNPEEKKT
jgi:cob(I)alamin adenosyltransferase